MACFHTAGLLREFFIADIVAPRNSSCVLGTDMPPHTLIPLTDFKAILGLDDREDALSQYCLITATYTIEQYCKRSHCAAYMVFLLYTISQKIEVYSLFCD
jgi:hypothetical protein